MSKIGRKQCLGVGADHGNGAVLCHIHYRVATPWS